MDAAALREICLSFPGAFEDFPFGPETSVFKVRAAVSGEPGTKRKCSRRPRWMPADLSVSLKCEPALAEQLRAAHPEITGAWHMNKTHWNGVRLDGALPDAMVRDMVEDSYDLVVATLSRKQQEQLGLGTVDRIPWTPAPGLTLRKRLVGGRLDYPGCRRHGEWPAAGGVPLPGVPGLPWRGLAVYRRVAQGILTWELQRRSGLRVRAESDVVRPGTRVVSGFGVGPFRINAPCEVVWVRRPVPGDGPQSAGFRLRDTARTSGARRGGV